jgi:FkbM family methyltransferase
VPFVHNRRLRRVGRSIPGLLTVYRFVLARVLLRRGSAALDYRGARIRIGTTTKAIVHSRLRPVTKEPWTVRWLERNVRDGDVLYDIGANVGAYSLIAASLGRTGLRVVAIEPGYANYASLCGNIVLNALGETVTALPVVLAEQDRLGFFSYTDVSAGAALHSAGPSASSTYRQPVLVYGLDSLIATFGLPAPTLVKLDVDGGEAAVLAGARATLRRTELRSLIVEVETDATDAVLAELAAAGFVATDRIDERFGEPLPGIWYGIFDRV